MKNTQIKVYDWPTRIFHWLFVASFVGAFFIAKTFDDESIYYPYHMLLGMILVLTVGLRTIWGFVGSKYARFSSFILKPTALVTYLKNLLNGQGERRLGHNPASSWAAITMMTLGLGLGATGYLMTTGVNKHFFKEVHELLANLFLVTAVTHIAGVLLHMIRHRDSIGLSMFHGKKFSVADGTGISHSHWGVGLLFLLIVSGFVFHLNKNYDATHQTLNLFGTTLQLGESEDHDKTDGREEHGSNDDDSGDDDEGDAD